MKNKQLVLYVDKNANIEKAKNIAERLNIEIITNNKEKFDILLSMDESGLALVSDNMKLYGDFSKSIKRLKQSNLQKEMLIRAVKIKGEKENLTALDATAGLGEDSILLADYGYNVELYEKNLIIR